MRNPEERAQELSLPPPRHSELGARALSVLSLVEHPRIDMPAEQVEDLFEAVSRIVQAKLEDPSRDFGVPNSLIALAHEVMQETSWKRADVGTAMARAYKAMNIESKIDSFEMRIRP